MCDSGKAVEKKIPCVKVARPESHGPKLWCAYPLAAFSASDEFDGAEDGESITLTYCEMTQEALDALPEFDGW